MNKIKLLVAGGIPDDNLAEVVAWTPGGVDLKFYGNTTLLPLMTDERVSAKEILFGGSHPGPEIRLPSRPDVIFNAVCNLESCSRALNLVGHLCEKAQADGIPVINHPKHVRHTSRPNSAALFGDLDGIVVPKLSRLRSPTGMEIHRMIQDDEIPFPSIIRTAGDHNGQRMIRLAGADDIKRLNSLPFDGRDYYVLPYIDYQRDDGVYRKFRMVKVGDGLLPRHMISSHSWNIHSTQRNDDANSKWEAKRDEKRFLEDPAGFLGSDLYDQIATGLGKTQLDYVAVDFSILPDGRAVFFECNACFNAFNTVPLKNVIPELNEAENRIRTALMDLVITAAARDGSREHSLRRK
jgi:hypothetical protein